MSNMIVWNLRNVSFGCSENRNGLEENEKYNFLFIGLLLELNAAGV